MAFSVHLPKSRLLMHTKLSPALFQQYSSRKQPSQDPSPTPESRPAFTFGLPSLSAADHSLRASFADSMLEKLRADPSLIHRIVFSDEGNFWPAPATERGSTAANTHRAHSRSSRKKPYAESPPLPSIVWCGMTTKEVIGPYFFNSHVTETSYLSMLRKYFLPQLLRRKLPLDVTWFQQDGAPPHRSRSVLQLLGSTFGHRLISYGAEAPALRWPARSQDLTPLDYFFWDFMKTKMQTYRPRTHENLRECLHFEMESIDPAVLERFVAQDFVRRLERCLEVGGKRFELEPVAMEG